MHIQCNEELIHQFAPANAVKELATLNRHSAILGDWHASIIHALGNQFLMYVHVKSLYSTIDFIDTMSNSLAVKTVHNLRGKILEMLNDYYCLTDYQENHIIQPFKNVTFGPVNDKRMERITQGIALAYQKRFLQARQQSAHGEVRLWELEDDINNTARRNLGDASPAETLRQLIWSGVN